VGSLARNSKENTEEAEEAHARLLRAKDGSDETGKASALEDEFRAGLIAIAACAFAVDAMCSSVREHTPWQQKVPTGYKQITETFARGFDITAQGHAQLRGFLRELFTWRAWAVHPPADWRKPVLHDDLNVGVEWRFIAFSASNARIAFDKTSKLVGQLLERPKPNLNELVGWTMTAKTLLAAALDTSP
jgi:phage-related protein